MKFINRARAVVRHCYNLDWLIAAIIIPAVSVSLLSIIRRKMTEAERTLIKLEKTFSIVSLCCSSSLVDFNANLSLFKLFCYVKSVKVNGSFSSDWLSRSIRKIVDILSFIVDSITIWMRKKMSMRQLLMDIHT